jgi:hypothetical protein
MYAGVPDHHPGLGDAGEVGVLLHRPREAEVGDDRAGASAAPGHEHDVAALEVAMDDPERVGGVEALGHLLDEPARLVGRQLAALQRSARVSPDSISMVRKVTGGRADRAPSDAGQWCSSTS